MPISNTTLFDQNIISLYGERGRQWLGNLPLLVGKIAESWNLSDLKPHKNLSYHYVLSGFQTKKPIILKMGLDREGLHQEACALRAFEGYGCVKLLMQQEGAILLERAVPGASLKGYFPENEKESIHITCDLIQNLHQAQISSIHHFPPIRDWLMALDQVVDLYNDPIFTKSLVKARALKNQLLKTSPKDVFLHGDLHHDNILRQGNGYVAIDPKGVIGDPAYEVAAFSRNPIPELLEFPDAVHIIQSRINEFALLLDMDAHRILDWCYVQAVLSWIWNHEDGLCQNYFRRLTNLFESMDL